MKRCSRIFTRSECVVYWAYIKAKQKKLYAFRVRSRDMSNALISNGHESEEDILADFRMYTEVSAIQYGRFYSTPISGKRGFVSKTENEAKSDLAAENMDKPMSNGDDTR